MAALPFNVFIAGVIVMVAGRFHVLFRDRGPSGDFPTASSFWLRLGSLLLADLLWIVALILFAVRAGEAR